MLNYLSPGVYVKANEPRYLIEGVKTNIAAFIGFSEKAQKVESKDGETVTIDLLNRPQRVESWPQYLDLFGGFVEGMYMPLAVHGYFQNNDGVSPCYVVSLRTMPKAEAQLFGADGKPQLIVAANQAGSEGLRLRVQVEERADAAPSFNLVIEKEKPSGGWERESEIKNITIEAGEGEEAKKICFNDNAPQSIRLELINSKAPLRSLLPRPQRQPLRMMEQFQPLPKSKNYQGEEEQRTGLAGLSAINEITMLCLPDLMASEPNQSLDLRKVARIQSMMVDHCTLLANRMAILDSPPHKTAQEIKRWRMESSVIDSAFAALYYPWIEINDPLTNRPIRIPPAGHIAGIWARNDKTVGVHKAPANEVVRGATGLAYQTTRGEQELLNPKGINCIRTLPGLGIRVWGARTLSSRTEWRYINVRRLFNFVKESIEQGTDWITFEPNNHDLWAKITREVTEFLTQDVWEKGMLAGGSPQEAFFVKCDEEVNPARTRNQGILNIEIGLAPITPAEFIIFRLVQKAGPNSES